MKAVVCIIHPGRPQPAKYGEFIFMPEWKALVWKQRVFDLRKPAELAEFHAAADKLISATNFYPFPTVRLAIGPGVDLATMPIGELVEGYRLRSREAKIHQMRDARRTKAELRVLRPMAEEATL